MKNSTIRFLNNILFDTEEAIRLLRDEDDDHTADLICQFENLKHSLAGCGAVPKRREELKEDIPGDGKLVAYVKNNPDYPGIGVMYEDPDGWQYDVALVENGGPEEDTRDDYDPDNIRVYVYADSWQDDYTNKFIIKRSGFDYEDTPMREKQ